VPTDRLVLGAEQKHPTEAKDGNKDDIERRAESPNAATVELLEREAPRRMFFEEDARDEVTGNDEKNVDANESARQDSGAQVKQDYAEHRDGA
jgi:hypothetical protein